MKKAVASALAAVLTTAGLTCCSGSHHRTARTTPVAAETSPAPEPLTPELAVKAFHMFVGNDDVARASGDERLALWWTSDGQSQLTAAAFRRAVAAGDPVPRYHYTSPVFYVPRLLPDGTQWFVVRAHRTTASGKSPHTVFMGFIRSKPGQHWRLSISTVLGKKEKPPKIIVDADGYAKPLATFDASLVIPPRLVPSIQATLAEEGPSSVAAKVMRTGEYTTGYYTDDQKTTKDRKGTGLHTSAVYAATSYPIFPLGTAGGGGFVLYALSRDTVVSQKKDKPDHVPVPKAADPFIDTSRVHDELDVSQTMQYAAVVPAKPKKGGHSAHAQSGKAEIIGADGGTVKASVPTT